MSLLRVPFVDLRPVNEPVLEDAKRALDDLVRAGQFTGGQAVAAFEEGFAEFCGQGECVGVSSGLDALRLALMALGAGRGDEVVVPALTFVATWEAVVQAGARPVPADVGPDGLLDPDAAAAAVTDRTWAIVPVHLYGQMADMRALEQVARGGARRLRLVEDAAQAHGARRDLLPAGELSDAAAYSFYPTKPLGALGDAGAVTTSLGYVAARVRSTREHGRQGSGDSMVHVRDGYTARLDAFQAAVLALKLKRLRDDHVERHGIAEAYRVALAGVGDLELPSPAPESLSAWHLYAVQTGMPCELAAFLLDRGIGTGRHYMTPPHLQPAYEYLDLDRFPVAERIAARTLSLPIWPGLRPEQFQAVVDGVRAYFAGPR